MFISFDNSLEDMREKILNGGLFFSITSFSAADLRIPPSHDFVFQDYSRLGL